MEEGCDVEALKRCGGRDAGKSFRIWKGTDCISLV